MGNTKKMVVLFLISLFLISGLALAANAAWNVSINISDVGKDDSDSVYETYTSYVRNKTYEFIVNVRLRGPLIGQAAVRTVNISIPNTLTYIANSNSTDSPDKDVKFRNVTRGSFYDLIWNATSPGSTILNGSDSIVAFTFNATVARPSTSDGYLNFTVNIKHHASVQTAALNKTEHYTTNNTIYVDNTVPTVSSARTTSASTINLTFSEKLNLSISAKRWGQFIVRRYNSTSGTWYNSSATRVESFHGGKNNLTQTVRLEIAGAWPTGFNNYLNITVNGTVKDRAGNAIVANAANADALASDGAAPGIFNITILHSTRQLIITFNETVLGTSLNITPAASVNITAEGGSHVSITSISANSTSGNQTTITLTTTTRDLIAGLRAAHIGTRAINFSAREGFITDSLGNRYHEKPNQDKITNVSITRYANDTTTPTLSSATYNANNRLLKLVFSETMDSGTLTNAKLAKVWLGNTTGFRRGNVSARGADASSKINTTVNSTVVYINLTRAVASNISSWVRGVSSAPLYLTIYNGSGYTSTIRDMAGNYYNLTNSTSVTVTYTRDSGKPNVSKIQMQNITATQLSLTLHRVKGGKYVFNITFSEYMDTNGSTLVVTYVTAAGLNVTNKVTGRWKNGTQWSGNLTIQNATPARDGQLSEIEISGARDISKLNIQNPNSTHKFIIDTTPPKVKYAYFQSYDFNSILGNKPAFSDRRASIIVVFTENVTVRSAAKINTSAVLHFNISQLSGGKTKSFRNSTYAVGSAVSNIYMNKTRIINISLRTNESKLNSSLDFNITIRGVYSKSLTRVGNASPIDVNAGQANIKDMAGNWAVPNTTAVDIADNMVEFQKNVWTSVSMPACINSTMIVRGLGASDLSCYSYVTGLWADVVAGNFTPLRGYRCKPTNNTQMYIYLADRIKCGGGSLPAPSLPLKEGWNLVGVAGLNNTNTTKWLTASWLASTVVDMVYSNIDAADMSLHSAIGATSFTYQGFNATPYKAYWISASYTARDYQTWTSTGFY